MSYGSWIRDDYSGSDWCDGFDQFVVALLRGGTATNSAARGDGRSTCYLRIDFTNRDPAYAGTSTLWPCTAEFMGGGSCDCDSGDSLMEFGGYPCDIGVDSGESGFCGADWDDFSLHYLEPSWWFNPLIGETILVGSYCLSANPSYYQEPDTDCGSTLAVGHGFNVRMHPVRLAFDAIRADYALTWARIALAFALEHDIWYWIPASRLARFVLRIITGWGETLIHELGHTYCGGGHCSVHDCCFELAAQAWSCRVTAFLGLPSSSDWPDWSATAPDDRISYGTTCEEDDGRHVFTWCDLVRPYEPGAAAVFWSTGCIS